MERFGRRRRTTQRTDVGGGRPSLPKVEGLGQLRVKGRPSGVATAIAQAGTSPIRSGTLSRRSLAMGILAWIVLGLVAGALAKFILPGQQGGGILLTIVLGIVGALVGGFLGTYVLGFGDISGFDLRSIAIAVGGALLVLFVYGFVARGR